jgi:hypothetical protein
MKWFHHECAAKYSPKLTDLGATLGLSGFGLFWNLLEEIGFQSDSFMVKISGLAPEADRRFEAVLETNEWPQGHSFNGSPRAIPILSETSVAQKTYASKEEIARMVPEFVRLRLFDRLAWEEYAVLYSAGFEERADDYTKRFKKGPKSVRRARNQYPDTIGITSDNVRQEQNRKEKIKKNIYSAGGGETQLPDLTGRKLLSEAKEITMLAPVEIFDLEPAAAKTDEIEEIGPAQLKRTILEWNRKHPSGRLDWNPDEKELERLLTPRSREFELEICDQLRHILGPDVTYPQIVDRALNLMLDSNARKAIANPAGWIQWAIYEKGPSGAPWVQLLTPQEEDASLRPLERYRGAGS